MDSDDYFDDDFVLDDATLNVLQQVEAKLQPQTSQKRPHSSPHVAPPPANPHPPKKPRTSAWKPALVNDDDDDFYPDITVNNEGSYLFGEGPTPSRPSVPQIHPRSSVTPKSNANTLISKPSISNTRAPSIRPVSKPPPQPPQLTRPPRFPQLPLPPQNVTQAPPHLPSSPYVPGLTPLSQADPSQRQDNTNDHALSAQLQQAQQEIEKLRISLQEADAKRRAKEGEVATLRRNIDKRDSDHAAEVSRLRDMKLQTEREKEKQQQEFKQEIDRFKSRLAFKQSELESAHRKTTSSSQNPTQLMTFSQSIQRTPFAKLSPQKTVANNKPKGPVHTFPGFQNGFQRTSPTVSPTKARKNGKGKAPEPPPPQLRMESNGSYVMETDEPPSPVKEITDPSAEVVPASFHDSLRHMILAHVAPGTEDFTLQSLLSSAANVDDPDTARDYQAQCRTIFEILTSDNDGDPPTICATIVTSFSRMAKILSQTAKSAQILARLILLIVNLYVLVTPCREILNTAKFTPGVTTETHPLVTALKNAFQILRAGEKTDHLWNPSHGLGNSILHFLEATSWLGPDVSSSSLSALLYHNVVVTTLLDVNNPHWFLSRALSVLSILASYQNSLTAPILNHLMQERRGIRGSMKAQLNDICDFLCDFSQFGNINDETLTARSHGLSFLFTLAISPRSSILAENLPFISGMISTAYVLTSLLWEEEREVVESPPLAMRTTSMICRVICLLHHLMYNSDTKNPGNSKTLEKLGPALFGREKHASVISTGVHHMFTIALGRLSYGALPQWLEPDAKEVLERTHGLAAELLESIVAGPEADMMWCAYNEPEEDQITRQDEELARAMAID